MKIYFSQDYSEPTYINGESGKPIMMDAVAFNLVGLVNFLEFKFGLYIEEQSPLNRLVRYYEAMNQFMLDEPDNILANSFNVSGLNTAKTVLGWHDELRSAGWNFDGGDVSERLSAMVAIANNFMDTSGTDLPDRIGFLINQIAISNMDCSNLEIFIPCKKSYFKPMIVQLLGVLEKHGTQITVLPNAEHDASNLSQVRDAILFGKKDKIKFNPNDTSLLIYKFPDQGTANEYLSFVDMEDVDVWINSENKQMDNWLKLMNKPQTGSTMNDCTPQLTQLFTMGVSLFFIPLNVNVIVEWLNMPIHPIERNFRRRLASMIVRQGGYINEECKKLIARYIDGEFVYMSELDKLKSEEEQGEIRDKGRKKREKLINTFLPPMESVNQITKNNVRNLLHELSNWANEKGKVMKEKDENSLWIDQLSSVVSMSDAFTMLLDTESSNILNQRKMDSWLSCIYAKGSYPHVKAKQGCRLVVNSPSKILSVADKCVWMGLGNEETVNLECSFLYPSEKSQLALNGCITPWNEECERNYHELMNITPLLRTKKQLILVVCENSGGKSNPKHSLIVRLENLVENLGSITHYPKLDIKDLDKVELVENGRAQSIIQIEHADLIRWPDHMSPTKIGNMIEYPFDFLMGDLLRITTDGDAQMPDVKTTQGNVAHAIIEALFSPTEGKRYADANEIKDRINNGFEDVYRQTIEAQGAILHLAENKLTEKLFHEQLSHCLNVLLTILEDNELRVTGCESPIECNLRLGLPKAISKDGEPKECDLIGVIDMILEDKDGHPIVIDFKWTSLKSYYSDLLSANRSVQLEMYRCLLGSKTKDTVSKVAYFLMPSARLYSNEHFVGSFCSQIEPNNTDNIVPQLTNSFIYRKKQIDAGEVETSGALEELQYVRDTPVEDLFPLVEGKKKYGEEGMKKKNKFSQYEIFNA